MPTSNLNLIEYGEEARINLAYVHHEAKNPLFESKIKRGFHGRFGNKYQIPDYKSKKLIIGGAAGGSNGARWATLPPHPLALPVTAKAPVEVHGKGGKEVPHAINPHWTNHFTSSRRGHLTIKEDKKTKEHVLTDHSDLPHVTEISRHATEKEARAAGDAHLAKGGSHGLPPYTPPADVKIDEPPADGVTSVGLLIREPDGRIWIREPSNHYGGYKNSFPKGTLDKGESLQHAAHRETYEETGLKAKIVGYLGDYHGDASTTRMYIADRTGGEPVTNDETWAVKLVTPDQARELFNRERDQDALADYHPDPEAKWLLKHYNGNEDRVATELLANAIYRAMNVNVPRAGTTEHEGRVALAYPAKSGKLKKIDKPNEKLGKAYMVDALLANWDFIGLTHDNVLWQGDEPVRLDQGGTLAYRAQGSTKAFGHTPGEVVSLQGKGGQARDTVKVSPLQKREQATEIYRELTPQRIDDLVDQAPFENLQMKEQVREALQARVRWMGQFGKGMIDEHEDARDPGFEEVLQDGVEKLFNLEELRYMKTKVHHAISDEQELFTASEKHQQSFKFLMDMGVGYSQEVDAMVHDSDPNYIDKIKQHMDDYHVIIAPMKKRDRAALKVAGKYKGDWTQLTDIVRGTISVPHPANIPSAIGSIKKMADERGWKISQLDSKLYVDPRRPSDTGPTSAGYRDMSIRLETDDGFQIELQFNWNDMIVAKDENHHLYTEASNLEREAGMKPTGEVKDRIDALNAQMKDNYSAVWDKVSGKMSGAEDPPQQTEAYKKLMAEKSKADAERKVKMQSKYNVGGSLFGAVDYTADTSKSYDQQLQDYVDSQKAKKKLKDDPSLYFNMDASTPLISLDQLEPTKSDPSGAVNAEKFMAQAAAGKKTKRDPITVRMGQNGKYQIVDGNATYAIAKKHGFAKIPVKIETEDKKKVSKTEKIQSDVDRILGPLGLPVKLTDLKDEDTATARSLPSGEIAIHADSSEKTILNAVVHEVGHLLDRSVLGTEDEWFTGSTAGDALYQLMKNSPTMKAVRNDEFKVLDGDTQLRNYMLNGREMFARAFHQYIAVKSQDPVLLAELKKIQNDPLLRFQFWPDEEFTGIASAIDETLKKIGKKNG